MLPKGAIRGLQILQHGYIADVNYASESGAN